MYFYIHFFKVGIWRTSLVECKGRGFDPWSGNLDSTCCVAQPKNIYI